MRWNEPWMHEQQCDELPMIAVNAVPRTLQSTPFIITMKHLFLCRKRLGSFGQPHIVLALSGENLVLNEFPDRHPTPH